MDLVEDADKEVLMFAKVEEEAFSSHVEVLFLGRGGSRMALCFAVLGFLCVKGR